MFLVSAFIDVAELSVVGPLMSQGADDLSDDRVLARPVSDAVFWPVERRIVPEARRAFLPSLRGRLLWRVFCTASQMLFWARCATPVSLNVACGSSHHGGHKTREFNDAVHPPSIR